MVAPLLYILESKRKLNFIIFHAAIVRGQGDEAEENTGIIMIY